jgi:hypothetical protein
MALGLAALLLLTAMPATAWAIVAHDCAPAPAGNACCPSPAAMVGEADCCHLQRVPQHPAKLTLVATAAPAPLTPEIAATAPVDQATTACSVPAVPIASSIFPLNPELRI